MTTTDVPAGGEPETTPPVRGGMLAGNYDFIGRRRTWAIISLALLGLAVFELGVRGLNLSIDFVGGSTFIVDGVDDPDLTSAELNEAVEAAGATDVTTQIRLTGDRATGAIVEMSALELGGETQAGVETAIVDATGAQAANLEFKTVGPSWGQRISSQALRALLVFLVVVVIYISLRLEAKMAGAAIVALVHDVTITIGIYALVGFTVSPSTVIALLTILGYSLYDTVVVFDRVEEVADELGGPGRRTYGEAVNTALNDVVWRSLNTSMTSLLPVGSLLLVGAFILGASTLQDLALALFIGMAVGTYSSIFVAGPFLAWWKETEPELAQRRERVEKAIDAGEEPGLSSEPGTVAAPPPITTEYVPGRGRRNKRRR